MRVLDYLPKPIPPFTRVSQIRDVGYVLINPCSSERGHAQLLAYDTVIDRLGDAEVDHAFKVAMTSPECGGMTILRPTR